jgi:hypothetical protein
MLGWLPPAGRRSGWRVLAVAAHTWGNGDMRFPDRRALRLQTRPGTALLRSPIRLRDAARHPWWPSVESHLGIHSLRYI